MLVYISKVKKSDKKSKKSDKKNLELRYIVFCRNFRVDYRLLPNFQLNEVPGNGQEPNRQSNTSAVIPTVIYAGGGSGVCFLLYVTL